MRGGEAGVCALVEHPTTPEPLMPFRFLKAIVRIRQDLLRSDPERRKLPALPASFATFVWAHVGQDQVHAELAEAGGAGPVSRARGTG